MEDFPEESEDSEELRKNNNDALRYMSGLDADELDRRLGFIFDLVDTNKDAVASRDELFVFLHQINERMDKNKAQETMDMLDHNGDGYVDFSEAFNALRNREELSEMPEGLKKRLEVCDKDKDGRLDLSELSVLMNPGRNPTLLWMDVDDYLADFDKDGDGGITSGEFLEDVDEDQKQDAIEEFLEFDKDDDGRMSRQELYDWLKEVSSQFDAQRQEAMEAVSRWMGAFAPNGLAEDDFPSRVAQLIAQKATVYGMLLKTPWLVGLQIPGVEEEEQAHKVFSSTVDNASKELEKTLKERGMTLEELLKETGMSPELIEDLQKISPANEEDLSKRIREHFEAQMGGSLDEKIRQMTLIAQEAGLEGQDGQQRFVDPKEAATPEFKAKVQAAVEALKARGELPADAVVPTFEPEQLERTSDLMRRLQLIKDQVEAEGDNNDEDEEDVDEDRATRDEL